MFRDDVEAERRSVFLFAEEFGEEHTIDGEPMTVVLDTAKRGEANLDMGLPSDEMVLYAATEDFPARVPVGAVMTIDGVTFCVKTWDEDMGMVEATLIRAE